MKCGKFMAQVKVCNFFLLEGRTLRLNAEKKNMKSS